MSKFRLEIHYKDPSGGGAKVVQKGVYDSRSEAEVHSTSGGVVQNGKFCWWSTRVVEVE